jgi:hypothetical protein
MATKASTTKRQYTRRTPVAKTTASARATKKSAALEETTGKLVRRMFNTYRTKVVSDVTVAVNQLYATNPTPTRRQIKRAIASAKPKN